MHLNLEFINTYFTYYITTQLCTSASLFEKLKNIVHTWQNLIQCESATYIPLLTFYISRGGFYFNAILSVSMKALIDTFNKAKRCLAPQQQDLKFFFSHCIVASEFSSIILYTTYSKFLSTKSIGLKQMFSKVGMFRISTFVMD